MSPAKQYHWCKFHGDWCQFYGDWPLHTVSFFSASDHHPSSAVFYRDSDTDGNAGLSTIMPIPNDRVRQPGQ